MKRLVIMALLVLGGTFQEYVSAQEPQDIPLTIIKEEGAGGGNTKAPAKPIIISQNCYTLNFPEFGFDCTFELRSGGIVVFSVFVPMDGTQITIPSSFSGNYEIRFVTDTHYYLGYITL